MEEPENEPALVALCGARIVRVRRVSPEVFKFLGGPALVVDLEKDGLPPFFLVARADQTSLFAPPISIPSDLVEAEALRDGPSSHRGPCTQPRFWLLPPESP